MKSYFNGTIVLLVALFVITTANAQEPLRVVTTLSSYAAIAKTIGGETVDVSYIAPARFDPHFIEPKPSDVLKLKRADLFIHSGLDLEAWREPLVNAAARAEIRSGGEAELDLSQRISLLEVPIGTISRAAGDIHVFGNPHYWLDPRNGIVIAEDIAAKLIKLNPQSSEVYQHNLSSFRFELAQKIQDWQRKLAPYQGKELVGYHNGWVYLVKFCGLKMEMFVETKPGIPPTPKHLGELMEYIRGHKITVGVFAQYNSKDAADRLSAETNLKITTLVQNVGEMENTDDYLKMMDYNMKQLIGALAQ